MTEILFKELSFAIIGATIEVHRTLGSGFLEAVIKKRWRTNSACAASLSMNRYACL